jgi:hypothetical protein
MVNFSGNQEFFHLVEKIDKIQLKIDKKITDIRDIKEEYNIPDADIEFAITDNPNLDDQNKEKEINEEIDSEDENLKESISNKD